MKLRICIAALTMFAATSPVLAQTAADSAAIRATALNYVEGWYEGNAQRMAAALHPELAKRVVFTMQNRSRLDQMSAMSLVRATEMGGGKNTPVERQIKNLKILDIYQNVAMVKAEMSDWFDFMQMAKWNGQWVIVNVLWEVKPRT